MKAIILAAGYGTRLYPLTKNKAKPLVEVNDKPMINYVVDKLIQVEEIDEIIVVSNEAFYKQYQDWKNTYDKNVPLTILNDGTKTKETRLGAVGDIHFAVQELNIIEEPILVIGGDNLFEFDLQDMVDTFKDTNRTVVGAVDLKDKKLIKERYGAIVADNQSVMTDFEEKPKKPSSTFASTCLYLFSEEDIENLRRYMETKEKTDNTGDFINYLSKNSVVVCHAFEKKWFDIGTHDQLEAAEKYLKQK